jgi:DNA-binding HxlR family transcriptional regulator
MLRREGDGCPVTGALQLLGDKWTLLIVRELARGARRTNDLIERLHPISSRTLVSRVRDMEHDRLVERRDLGGVPPHVEYALTERGRLLLPLVEMLRKLGIELGCNECEDRLAHFGNYCDACPYHRDDDGESPQQPRRRERDDSIVLL